MTKYHIFLSGEFGSEHKICNDKKQCDIIISKNDSCDIVAIIKGGTIIQ